MTEENLDSVVIRDRMVRGQLLVERPGGELQYRPAAIGDAPRSAEPEPIQQPEPTSQRVAVSDESPELLTARGERVRLRYLIELVRQEVFGSSDESRPFTSVRPGTLAESWQETLRGVFGYAGGPIDLRQVAADGSRFAEIREGMRVARPPYSLAEKLEIERRSDLVASYPGVWARITAELDRLSVARSNLQIIEQRIYRLERAN